MFNKSRDQWFELSVHPSSEQRIVFLKKRRHFKNSSSANENQKLKREICTLPLHELVKMTVSQG